MTRFTLLLAPLLLGAPLGAQGFEGTIHIKSSMRAQTMDLTVYLKDGIQAMNMKLPENAGRMAGSEVRMVMDNAAGKITMMIPAAAGMPLPPGTKGIKMVMNIDRAAQAADDHKVSIDKLGSSQMIAGMKCDDYLVTTDTTKMNVCVTSELGRFMFPGSGGPGRARQQPEWIQAFGDKPAFPLKVWQADDSSMVVMEVTSIERGPVPAGVFDTDTAGYMDMSGMMRRRPGGR